MPIGWDLLRIKGAWNSEQKRETWCCTTVRDNSYGHCPPTSPSALSTPEAGAFLGSMSEELWQTKWPMRRLPVLILRSPQLVLDRKAAMQMWRAGSGPYRCSLPTKVREMDTARRPVPVRNPSPVARCSAFVQSLRCRALDIDRRARVQANSGGGVNCQVAGGPSSSDTQTSRCLSFVYLGT